MDFVTRFTAAEQRLAEMHKAVEQALTDHGLADLNVERAMIVLRMPRDQVTVGQLLESGAYGGTNISYNLNRLAQTGYVSKSQAPTDARSVLVSLTPKGRAAVSSLRAALDGASTAEAA